MFLKGSANGVDMTWVVKNEEPATGNLNKLDKIKQINKYYDTKINILFNILLYAEGYIHHRCQNVKIFESTERSKCSKKCF